METVFSGEDKRIYLTLSNSDGLINLNDFENVLCHIVDSKNVVIAKFSREILATYEPMAQQGNNVLVINLKKTVTANIARDTYKLEVLTKKVDADFPERFKSMGVIPAFKISIPSTESINL